MSDKKTEPKGKVLKLNLRLVHSRKHKYPEYVDFLFEELNAAMAEYCSLNDDHTSLAEAYKRANEAAWWWESWNNEE